ncbi:hypothetical protein I4U23_021025 [Adineta vaga]|nr:hypothetical protein I4U23_021025 [Adineta vaga]
MGHYGKHPIDPETGLCEICDQNAIQDFRQGKRLDQQNPNPYSNTGSALGSYIRKSANAQVPPPPPPMQPRRVVYENNNDAPVVQRRIMRHGSTPNRDVYYQPSPRSSFVYDSQVFPQYSSPMPGRPVRVVHQYAQTPPPPTSQIVYTGPRRKINSGVPVLQQQPRIGREAVYYQPGVPNNLGPQYVKVPRVYQIEGNRRQQRLEPLERRALVQPQPQPQATVIRRVYKKLPPGKYDSLSSRSFAVSPQPPPPVQEPVVYHIRLED